MDKNGEPQAAKLLSIQFTFVVSSPTCEMYDVLVKFMGEFILKTRLTLASFDINQKIVLSECNLNIKSHSVVIYTVSK